MQNKIDTIKVKGNIVITEKELLSWIKPYAKTVEGLNIHITKENIRITGKLTLIKKSTFEAIIIPKAENKKLLYDIKEMKLGNAKAPKYLSNMVIKKVNENLDENINSILKVNSVILEKGKIVLGVEKK